VLIERACRAVVDASDAVRTTDTPQDLLFELCAYWQRLATI
jgi:hypothetical protein